MRLLIITAVFLLTELASALADVRILASPGGDVVPFLKLFGTLRYSGERVTIDGPCYSACTLVLSEISRNRICVTSRAVLGFHAERASRPGSNILIRSQGRAADTLSSDDPLDNPEPCYSPNDGMWEFIFDGKRLWFRDLSFGG